MSQSVSDTQIEQFRLFYEQLQRDTAWQVYLRQGRLRWHGHEYRSYYQQEKHPILRW